MNDEWAVHIDTETFGMSDNGLLVTVGACWFNRDTIDGRFYMRIDPVRAQKMGCTIDADTVLFWLRQHDQLRSHVYRNMNDDGPEWQTYDPMYVMSELRNFMVNDPRWKEDNTDVWANPAWFDLPKIEYMVRASGALPIWQHWQGRCYRSVVRFAERFGIDPTTAVPRTGSHHNALDDAISQTLRLQYVWRELEARHIVYKERTL